MKPIKLISLFFTLFTLTVTGFTQTPDRVFPEEEFQHRRDDITFIKNSSVDFKFIGVVLGLGVHGAYSDNYKHFQTKAGEDSSGIPPFHVDFSFRYGYLFLIKKFFNIGFMINLGFWTDIFTKQPFYFGGNFMFAVKMYRSVIGLGGYFYYAREYTGDEAGAIIKYKKIDIGIIGCLNIFLGSEMKFFIGLETRMNLNKNRLVSKYNALTGTYLNPDEVGYFSFNIKLGIRF